MPLVGLAAPALVGLTGQEPGFGIKSSAHGSFFPSSGSSPNYYLSMNTLDAGPNDVQVIIVGLQDSAASASLYNTGQTLPAGWTLQAEAEHPSQYTSINVFSKVGSNTASSEDLYVVGGSGTTTAEVGYQVALVFSGADTGSPFDISPTILTGLTSNYDPASVTVPNVGSIMIQYSILGDRSSTSPAVSSGYDTIAAVRSFQANDYSCICGSKVTDASPENAGALTHGNLFYAFTQFAIKEAA